MGKIFCIIGKSATGKDSLYKKILSDYSGRLSTLVTYTTRPIRSNETDGIEYHFTDIDGFNRLKDAGKVIEYRCYHTVHGDWYYFTADDGQINDNANYLLIMTLEGYEKLVEYLGPQKVVPLYVEVEDGIRLTRALEREKIQTEPKYTELCRRFLADSLDFSEENLKRLNITTRYENIDFNQCVRSIEHDIDLQIENK